ncbi:MAG: ankyrin repeat domain-containing protein [Chlamydiae bacterium]|nr:ankyrin repeat domain-containing protein [Chlamydiota bacterium]
MKKIFQNIGWSSFVPSYSIQKIGIIYQSSLARRCHFLNVLGSSSAVDSIPTNGISFMQLCAIIRRNHRFPLQPEDLLYEAIAFAEIHLDHAAKQNWLGCALVSLCGSAWENEGGDVNVKKALIRYLVEERRVPLNKCFLWETALLQAISSRDLFLVQYLVQQGADVNLQGEGGEIQRENDTRPFPYRIPLQRAMGSEVKEIISFLLAQKNIKIETKVLSWVLMMRKEDLIERILFHPNITKEVIQEELLDRQNMLNFQEGNTLFFVGHEEIESQRAIIKRLQTALLR